MFANALRSGRADFLGDPGLLHTYSYVPDVARGLATLGTDARAVGEVWHLPAPAATTTTSVLDMLAAEVGRPVRTRSLPRPVLRGLGLVNPMMRELAEMLYEFEEPFVLDTAKFDTTFGPAAG